MKAAGLIIPDSWEFGSFEEAIKFVQKTPARYVVKPSGKAQNDKVLSFVGREEDGKDVVAILERYKKGWCDQSPQPADPKARDRNRSGGRRLFQRPGFRDAGLHQF